MDVKNRIEFTILEDGVISVSTNAFGAKEVHQEAEELLNETFKELGGERKVVLKKPHTHAPGVVHTHSHATVKS